MFRSIKGVNDILPSSIDAWELIETTARDLATRYGYSEIRTPIFEQTDLFSRSIGGSTDIVEKEMYTFEDRNGTFLTLRPEGTAGVVRAYIEHNLAAHLSSNKLYYLGPMFRHERPQAGRFRQFHQFGIEAFGVSDPWMDVEVISLLWRFLSTLGVQELTLLINSLGTLQERQVFVEDLKKYLRTHLDSLCANCSRRLDTNPLRILDCKVDRCRKVTESAPILTDYLASDSAVHFEEVRNGLVMLGIPFTSDPRLVRGLDYYSRTTFEITSPFLGAQSTVGAGGRYDGLVQLLGGTSTPAIGFALGLERLSLLLSSSSIPPRSSLIFVAGFGARGRKEGFKLLDTLRAAGLSADTDLRALTLKSHLRSADRLSAIGTLILGDDEAANGTSILRDMRTKKQEVIPLESITEKLVTWTNQQAASPKNS